MLSYDNKLYSVSYHNAQAADDVTVEMTVKLRGLKYLAKKKFSDAMTASRWQIK